MNQTRIDSALKEIERQFCNKAEQIKDRCQYLIRCLERTIQNCDLAIAQEPYSINSLGEVQQTGLDIDRTCAELKVLSDMLGLAHWVAKGDDEQQ